jgi:hypothetical protein
VAESARAEVHADPYAILFIHKKVDIVITAADGSELVARHLLKRRDGLQLPRRIVKEHVRANLLVARFVVLAAYAEADDVPHIVHDASDVGAQLGARHVEAHGLIAAADVITNAGRADGIPVGDYAADGNTVANVVVRHEGDLVRSASADANLVQSALIGRAEDRNLVVKNLHSYHWIARFNLLLTVGVDLIQRSWRFLLCRNKKP